jgi:glycosyltransferase involved in cell wall biosynthesis
MASKDVLISVVMPGLNCAGHVLRGVLSALEQSHGNLELLFVDNGSADDTLERLRQVSDSRLIVLQQPQRGVSRARNLAIRQARGEFVAFLDSDDTWHPQFLEKMLEALEAAPDAALAYCGWQNLGLPDGRSAPFVPPDFEPMDKVPELIRGCRWPIHAALTRTRFVRDAGAFDERLAVGEDFLLWMEIGCFHRVLRVPEVLAYYHHHEGEQATKNAVRSALQALEAKQAFLRRHPKVAARLGRRLSRDLAYGPLLELGLNRHWRGDLQTARPIFRRLMAAGYGQPADWKYMIPALLPLAWHRELTDRARRSAAKSP